MSMRDLDRGDDDIRKLKRLLGRELTANQRFLVESELRRLTGKAVETASPAQILDFYCSNPSRWAVLHNLKLKDDTGIHRIDHLVISRYFDVVLLNSTCFYHDLKISVDGEYKLFDGRDYQPIGSPYRKCQHQLDMLVEIFNEDILAPSRIGVPLRPKLYAVILVSPSRNVMRPPGSVLDTRHVMAANQFVHKLLRHRLGSGSRVARLVRPARYCSRVTLERIARELAALHQSACIDFAAEIGLDQDVCLPERGESTSGLGQKHPDRTPSLDNSSPAPDPLPAPESIGGAG
jgi:hypothetical protein